MSSVPQRMGAPWRPPACCCPLAAWTCCRAQKGNDRRKRNGRGRRNNATGTSTTSGSAQKTGESRTARRHWLDWESWTGRVGKELVSSVNSSALQSPAGVRTIDGYTPGQPPARGHAPGRYHHLCSASRSSSPALLVFLCTVLTVQLNLS